MLHSERLIWLTLIFTKMWRRHYFYDGANFIRRLWLAGQIGVCDETDSNKQSLYRAKKCRSPSGVSGGFQAFLPIVCLEKKNRQIWTAIILAFIDISTWNLQRYFKIVLFTLCESFVWNVFDLNFWWRHCRSRIQVVTSHGRAHKTEKKMTPFHLL